MTPHIKKTVKAKCICWQDREYLSTDHVILLLLQTKTGAALPIIRPFFALLSSIDHKLF